ncbi:bifunctional diaminohydroxyphosphoribosylaminopyrimidine deaminase/5-amino-6-(5-phosphoribosylamino)uracil reductase RibD [Lacimicrobium alkaliphilum]|uniref:Riboflavin biosynthesis protein RibD n=1 Tax=Lacimicrobium alkaliphilum TaxID=1526571 RepID=A0ABQ1R5T7_9ALTE|nr:bifunctional diaminohydroxyphosphoribosylaminopyrimidine deaminase/5-amino-6-(5-phosphoribosylamino)uracil reductase RibD [Lacimicrobium alkaliphilum]GGD57166.1 riboflavin biosynthesis protein RibD [Lacimicrobium alkaliphilum]
MAEFSRQDHQMMALALKLAGQGRYTVSPNPMVGCVIVDHQGNIVGRGAHQRAGEPHAEVYALREAADKARGAIAYVTLEPCSHYGRTPPCAQALIDAGVSKVVAAVPDPNPQVAGQGLAMLQKAGINTAVGLMREQAKALNRGFFCRTQHGRPFVTLKLAASLDGKTAMANGHSQWITGEAARLDVQRHRAKSCALLTGSGTVLIDDPSLNMRLSAAELGIEGVPRQPLRIIVDSKNQLTPGHRLFSLEGDILLANKRPSPHMYPRNVYQWQCQDKKPRVSLPALMVHLAQRGINNLWVEAGAALAGAMLEHKLVDELVLYQAPKLMGDKAKGMALMPSLSHMDQATNLNLLDVRMLGDDIKLTARVCYQNLTTQQR